VGRFIESLLSFFACIGTMHWSGFNVGQASRLPRERASASGMTGLWSASPPGQAGRLPYLAVHGKLPFLFEMHWDHEPDRTIRCCSCNTNLSEHFPWFRESPLGLTIVHWDPEPLAVPRRTKSADKSDALQTLRAIRRRPAVAKRLECVRLQRRFPKAGCDSMAGQVHGKPPRL